MQQIETDLLEGAPLSDVLRKVIVLGGRANSGELRDWASRELNGYAGTPDPIPAYRRIGAQIRADAITANAKITGQPISVSSLPEFARDSISEEVTLPNSIRELESLVALGDAGKPIQIALPMAADLAQIMDSDVGDPFQHITGLYWAVSKASVEGVLDRIRTKLAELVAELSATMPATQDAPSAEQASAAVTFLVTGRRSKVSFSNAQATGNGNATSMQAAAEDNEPGWWTLGRKVGAFVVGCCVIAGVVISYLAYIK
jgi:AbiTii